MPSPEPLTAAQGETLLGIARDSIAHGLDSASPLPVVVSDYDQALQAVRASFVTLNIEEQLRGCIGALEAKLPLVEDVAQHSFAAAFQDPRFPRLSRSEFPCLEVHISILTPSEAIQFNGEADLLGKLRPGIDGLIIAQGSRRATFLPSVWESLPDPAQFLAHLKTKAGLGNRTSTEPLQAWRYTTESIPTKAY